jgi:hypothetical protein
MFVLLKHHIRPSVFSVKISKVKLFLVLGKIHNVIGSGDSAVGIATGYGLDDRGVGV